MFQQPFKVDHEQKPLTTALTDAAWRAAENDVRNRRRTWGLTLCRRGEMNGARVRLGSIEVL